MVVIGKGNQEGGNRAGESLPEKLEKAMWWGMSREIGNSHLPPLFPRLPRNVLNLENRQRHEYEVGRLAFLALSGSGHKVQVWRLLDDLSLEEALSYPRPHITPHYFTRISGIS